MTLVRLEIHASDAIASTAQDLMAVHPFTMNVARLRGASVDPAGDVLSCDVPREAASGLLDQLEAHGVADGDNSITVTSGLAHVGQRASDMESHARGSASDALLWPVVEDTLAEEVELSVTFAAFMILATLLAAIGVVTNSAILVVGAMVLGPEFGPIANFCVSALGGHVRRSLHAWVTVTVGFLIAIAAAIAFTVALRELGIFPSELARQGLVQEVASPKWLTLIIALIAGVAGMLALTSARSATLVGVLISVTTIPAAGDAAVLFSYGQVVDAASALLTLAINLTGIATAGIATLATQRALVPRLHRLPELH